MNYKKIFKSQKFRFFILRALRPIPPQIMLSLQYWLKLNRRLNIKNPLRFSEKVQHYKLYYRNEKMIECVDKFLVRNFVKSRGGEKFLNTLYGVYNNAEEINFKELPQKFVIKTTDGSGGENIFICKDKSVLNIDRIIKKVNNWKNKDIGTLSHEWAYKNSNSSKIIVEKFLEDRTNNLGEIDDYKFFCFNGKAHYVVVDVDRYNGHKRNFYDINWNSLNISSDCPKTKRNLHKPSRFDDMIEFSEQLSADFPFVRVDLYCVDDKIIFGEMTFYPWSGYVQFSPDTFDYELGKHFNIDYK